MVHADRYHRQRLVDGIGDGGQDAICNATVAIVGVGALGCMNATLLARAGVGHIIIIDRDIVETTNLQRQILFTEEDANTQQPKAIAAKNHLLAANSEITITSHVEDLTSRNIRRLLASAQLIVDGLDNFQTRYLLNDYAVQEKIPYMFAGVIAGQGNVMSILPDTPCLRCLFPDPPPPSSQETCDTVGVLSPAIGIAASCQSMDTIKFLSGNRDSISPTLLTFDLWTSQSNRVEYGNRVPNCPCCGENVYEFLDGNHTNEASPLCGKNAIQIPSDGSFDMSNVKEKLCLHGSVTTSDFVVRGTLHEEHDEDGNPIEIICFHDGRVVVHGTHDVGRAKSIRDRFIGN